MVWCIKTVFNGVDFTESEQNAGQLMINCTNIDQTLKTMYDVCMCIYKNIWSYTREKELTRCVLTCVGLISGPEKCKRIPGMNKVARCLFFFLRYL